MERILLTGASGFVGSHVLAHLLKNTEAKIVCPVTFTHKGIADRIRLVFDEFPYEQYRVTIIQTDLAAPISKITDKAFGDIDTVFNIASESHVDRSIVEPGSFIQNNVALVTNLYDWARLRGKSGPSKILQISTDEVYGPAQIGHDFREWFESDHRPSNPYAASKAAQEDIAFSYWRTYDLPIVLSNTMNIIGEMQDAEKFVPLIISKILKNEPIDIHSSKTGDPGSRFYLYARNQASALTFLATTNLDTFKQAGSMGYALKYSESTHSSPIPHRYHVVGEKEVNNLALADHIFDLIPKTHKSSKILNYNLVDFHSSRPGHDLRYALNGDLIKSIGWEAPIGFEDSLEKTVKWYLEHPEWLDL